MGEHGAHDWWYACQERAGLVAPGQTSGAKMHRSRYTAGQRILDATGNLKAAQALLGHASISTTADTYTDWDVERLESSLRPDVRFRGGGMTPCESFPPSRRKIPANRDFMEAAGIEPASADAPGERLRA